MTLPASVPAIPHPDFFPERLSNDELEDSISELSACISVATWRLLMLIGELERRELWGYWGCRSMAHWLNWKCGIDIGAAREKMRVARALPALPKISTAFSLGQISYSKVRAMTRVATPVNEDFLLSIALHGTAAHVERLVRSYRRVERNRETAQANRVQGRREFRWGYEDDGSMVIRVRLPPEQGALVLKAVQAAQQELPAMPRAWYEQGEQSPVDKCVSAETLYGADEPGTARRADALCHIAEQFLGNDTVPARQAERYQVMVHVDRDALSGGCALEDGPALATETARRLSCDAGLVEIRDDESGEALDIGRQTRSIPPAIRRALQNRDQGCRFPGCTHQHYVDAHHIEHWADGGPTSMGNLVLLCRWHHRLVHEGGFSIQNNDQALTFLRSDGIAVPQVPKPNQTSITIDNVIAESCVHVSAETGLTKWTGERMDMGLAIEGMLQCTPGGIEYVPPPPRRPPLVE